MPIDIATGNVELAREDFALPGRVPLKWTRHFRSVLLKSVAPLAPGWTISLFSSLKRVGKEWHFTTGEGDLHIFVDPERQIDEGHTIRLLGAYLELIRREDRFIVTQWDVDSEEIQRFVFAAERRGGTLTLVGIEDVCGDGLDLTWDTSGRLTKLRQRIENRTVVVSYSADGRIDALALVTSGGAQIQLVRYEYDTSGRLLAAFDRRGLANRYEYDAHSRVTREILKDGAVYSYKYDEKGRCIRFSGLDHYNEKRLQFLDGAHTTIVTNSYGKSWVYQCTPSGQIAADTDPSGNQRRTAFDEYNRIVAEVDATGATTNYTYDEHGNRNSITDPSGNTYRFAFNVCHQPVSLTDPLGKTWVREYNAKHRVVATQNPLGARWAIDYDEAGNPAAITDPLNWTRRQRFTNGLLRERTDWMGHVTRFNWDDFGRVIEKIGPVGERTTFRYDPAGNPVEIDLPDGGRLRAAYDSGDNLSRFTDAKGQTIYLRYAACRRLLERVDAIGRVMRYVWGSEPERLDAVINEKGETFSYIRDDQGRVICERSFDGREQHVEYDAAGHVVGFINGNGERIQLKRDTAGRVEEQILPDGATTRFEYDPIGRIVTAINPDVAVRLEYDAAGRLIYELQGEHWVRTDYNAAGEVTRTRTSLGHEVRYELDPNGRVQRLTTGDNQTLTFERDARGLETGRQMPGGMRLEQRFDSIGRLIEQRVGQSLSSYGQRLTSSEESQIGVRGATIHRHYRYDAVGQLVTVKDRRWGMTDYAYDPAERLLSALHDRGLNEFFEYDSTDNLVRMQGPQSGDNSCSYGPGNRLLRWGNARYEYDPEGRLVRKTEFADSDKPHICEYTWDAQGQLRKLRRPDGEEWEYKYDAFGRRISKRGPTSIRHFVWDGDVMVHERQQGAKAVAWIMHQKSFAPLGRVYEGVVFSVVNDHLGTPQEMLDNSGRVVWAASRSAWGSVKRLHTSNANHDCPIRFQGQWFDEESGLHYNRSRYYIPELGRFASQDAIRLQGSTNFYSYVRNPNTQIDPFGLSSSQCTDPLPDDALVVKGGLSKKSKIDTFNEPGVGQVTGTSAGSNPGRTVPELSQGLPHGQVRTTTVGAIRAAGGDVIPTRRSPNNPDHVTITGLTPEQIDKVLGPPIPNPALAK